MHAAAATHIALAFFGCQTRIRVGRSSGYQTTVDKVRACQAIPSVDLKLCRWMTDRHGRPGKNKDFRRRSAGNCRRPLRSARCSRAVLGVGGTASGSAGRRVGRSEGRPVGGSAGRRVEGATFPGSPKGSGYGSPPASRPRESDDMYSSAHSSTGACPSLTVDDRKSGAPGCVMTDVVIGEEPAIGPGDELLGFMGLPRRPGYGGLIETARDRRFRGDVITRRGSEERF